MARPHLECPGGQGRSAPRKTGRYPQSCLAYRYWPRPFRAWGYPVAPFIFAAASLLIVLNALWRSPSTSGAGLLVILAGLPVYMLMGRARQG